MMNEHTVDILTFEALPNFNVIASVQNIKLQPVPPFMPSETLSILYLDIDSASNGIDGGTSCNFIFFSVKFPI